MCQYSSNYVFPIYSITYHSCFPGSCFVKVESVCGYMGETREMHLHNVLCQKSGTHTEAYRPTRILLKMFQNKKIGNMHLNIGKKQSSGYIVVDCPNTTKF